MEFLMTYGWALMVIVTIMASLVYFDILNPSLFIPDKCYLGYRVNCDDFLVRGAPQNHVYLTFSNTFPEPLLITAANVSSSRMSGVCANTTMALHVASGDTARIDLDCPSLALIGERGKVKFSTEIGYYFDYSVLNTSPAYNFPLYGEISSKIER